MKCQIRVISQCVLANADKLPLDRARLKVYGSCDVNLPEPVGGRDYLACLTAWMSTYAKVLRDDPSAVIKIVPYVNEPNLPF